MSSSRPRCRQPCLRELGDGGEEESTYKAWKWGDDRQNQVPWSPEDGELVAGQAWRCCLVGGPCTEPSAGRMGRLWEGTGAEQALPAEGAEKPRAHWVTGRGLRRSLALSPDECGIVAQISEPLAAADIPAYYISTFKFDHALVSVQHRPWGRGGRFRRLTGVCLLPFAGSRRKHQRRHQCPESQPSREALEGLLPLLPVRPPAWARPRPKDFVAVFLTRLENRPRAPKEGVSRRRSRWLTPPAPRPKPRPPRALLPSRSPQTLRRSSPGLLPPPSPPPPPPPQETLSAVQGACELTHLVICQRDLAPSPGHWGTDSCVVWGVGAAWGRGHGAREGPREDGGSGYWSLVSGSIGSGLVPAEWRPVGSPLVTCW